MNFVCAKALCKRSFLVRITALLAALLSVAPIAASAAAPASFVRTSSPHSMKIAIAAPAPRGALTENIHEIWPACNNGTRSPSSSQVAWGSATSSAPLDLSGRFLATRVGRSFCTSPIFLGLKAATHSEKRRSIARGPTYGAPVLLRVSRVVVATKPAATAADVESTMGGLPKGKSPGVRTVDSVAELNQTFDSMTAGGTPSQWPGYNGKVVRLPDGTEVGLRNASKSGGETIDVRVPGKPPTKVHIE